MSHPHFRLGYRSRRHQDRDHRARRAGARTAAPPGADAAGRLRRDRRRGRRAGDGEAERELGGAAASASARRDRSRAPRGLLRESNSVCLNGRPIRQDLASRARARGPHRQRRQLLRAVGGHRRRRRGRGRRVRRDPRHRRRCAASSCAAGCWTDPTPSPASGATIRCPGRATTNGPADVLLRPSRLHRDLAVRPRHRARSSAARPARRWRRRDRRARRGRRRRLRERRWPATRSAWRARSPT